MRKNVVIPKIIIAVALVLLGAYMFRSDLSRWLVRESKVPQYDMKSLGRDTVGNAIFVCDNLGIFVVIATGMTSGSSVSVSVYWNDPGWMFIININNKDRVQEVEVSEAPNQLVVCINGKETQIFPLSKETYDCLRKRITSEEIVANRSGRYLLDRVVQLYGEGNVAKSLRKYADLYSERRLPPVTPVVVPD